MTEPVATTTPPSKWAVVALVVANIVPALGVLFAQWDPFRLLILYWFESAVVGLFNLPRMWTASQRPAKSPPRPLLCTFFAVHYGMFMYGHLVFLTATLTWGSVEAGDHESILRYLGQLTTEPWIRTALGGLILSHTYSFFANWLRRGEYLTISPAKQMTAVYRRVVLMHVAIVCGGLLIAVADLPSATLLMLVAAKLGIDLHAHWRSHQRFAANHA